MRNKEVHGTRMIRQPLSSITYVCMHSHGVPVRQEEKSKWNVDVRIRPLFTFHNLPRLFKPIDGRCSRPNEPGYHKRTTQSTSVRTAPDLVLVSKQVSSLD